ncbi:hypothetical protein SAMN05444272_2791 [Roseibium suaedae]|uniref:Uncharacterized protein n=2 Tax=Roseibium suaedae TaxID=735517 RepID=A0A1M7KCP0_9HYPH|nr:hypothetical protein SAMN05444272_2791 [Roseibium suaedae]
MVVYGAKDGAFLMIHAPVGSTNPNDVILAHSRIHAGKDRGCVPDDGPIPVLFGLDGFSKFDEDLSVLDVPK